MKKFLTSLWFAAAVLLAATAHAIDPASGDLTAAQEARYRKLAAELRCLVCQNQSLADSNAGLAADMRAVVRLMIKNGETDAAIQTFMTDRYGDFVLYRPPLRPSTALLWALPFLVISGGIIAGIILMRRQRKTSPTLSEADRQKATALLKE